MKTILITGGAGFIGTNLCKKLISNNRIICVDNLFTGNIDNIKELFNNKNFKFVNHNIIDPLIVSDKIDIIYNLACPASPIHYLKDPIFTAKTCFQGTLNMLELAKIHKAVLVLASTSEIYGDPIIHPQKELYWGNVNPIGIRSCYDEGKRIAETLCMDYKRLFGTDVKIIRIFNTYGPYMSENDGRVVSNFIIQALNNKDITIYGDGTQTRSFLYIDDLIDALIILPYIQETGPINIGNPEEYTVKELADLIILLTNSDSKIIYQELPLDDPKKRKPNITLAKELLQWLPLISIKQGLINTINYFKYEI